MLKLPETEAILGLIISSYIFFRVAKQIGQEKMTLDGFMLSDRSLISKDFSGTFSASCFSLAMTLMYFFSNSETYGLFLLVSPITYLAGQFFFLWVIKKANVNFKDCRTLSDVWYSIFPSKAIARLITLITCSSFLAVVFIELLLGSIVFSLFFPKNVLYQTLSFFGMGTLVLSYVRIGGYKAIVRTDRWQLFLMMSAILAIFIYSVLMPMKQPADIVYKHIISYSAGKKEILAYALWLTIINFMMPFSQVSYWQRVAASTSIQESWLGLIRSSWKVLLLFCLSIISFVVLNAKGYHYPNFQDFLIAVKQSSLFSSLVLFPVMIIGLCSTVFSSADVAVMAIIYALSDKNTFLEKLNSLSDRELRHVLTKVTLIMLFLLSLVYSLQFSNLNLWIVPLIYSIVGQLVIISPLPIYVLLKSRQRTYQLLNSPLNTTILFSSIVFVWFTLLFSVGFSKVYNDQFWTQIITLFGSGLILAAFSICPRKKGIYYERYNC